MSLTWERMDPHNSQRMSPDCRNRTDQRSSHHQSKRKTNPCKKRIVNKATDIHNRSSSRSFLELDLEIIECVRKECSKKEMWGGAYSLHALDAGGMLSSNLSSSCTGRTHTMVNNKHGNAWSLRGKVSERKA